MGVPFKVLFLCNCGNALEEFDLFMLHKQKYHSTEFEKIKCIVFEENITFRPDSPGERNPVTDFSNNELQEQETDFTQLLQDQPDQDQLFNVTPEDEFNDLELLNSVKADSHLLQLQPSIVTAIANFPCPDSSMAIDENENFKTAAPEPKLPNTTVVSEDEQTDEEFSDETLDDDDYDSDESDPDGGFYMSDISDSDLAFESEFAQLETELLEIDSSSQNTFSLLPKTKIDGATTTGTETGTGTGMTTNDNKNKPIDNNFAQSTTRLVKTPSENPADAQFKLDCQQQQCLESHQSKNHQNQNQEKRNSDKKILCKFKCDLCGEFFRLQHFLNRHIALVHSVPSPSSSLSMIDEQPKALNSQCSQPNCTLTFQTASDLLAHDNLHKMYTTATAAATSQAEAEAETLYLCCEDNCDKIFSTFSTFEAHVKAEHGGTALSTNSNSAPLFPCQICQESFQLESHLKSHCTLHEKPFTCPHKGCNSSFKFKRYLQQHEQVHLSPGRRRQTRLLQSLSLQSPPGPRPRPRPEVQVHHKLDVQISQNNANPKGDSGSIPCICEVCGRAFSQFFHLKRHLVKHSKDLPFNCPQPTCKRSFKTTAAVKLHCQRSHGDSDSQKIKCVHPSCSEAFSSLRARRDHLETEHLEDRPHHCPHKGCDKSFTNPVGCKRHVISKHKGSGSG